MTAQLVDARIRRSPRRASKLATVLAVAMLVAGLSGCSALAHILPSAVHTLTPAEKSAALAKCDTLAYAAAVKQLAVNDTSLVKGMTAAQEHKFLYPIVVRDCAKAIAKKFPHNVIPISGNTGN